MKVNCPVSLGELVDKITILKIKTEKIADQERNALAAKEHRALANLLESLNLEGIDETFEQLYQVNLKLWGIEDDIRIKEREQKFDDEFIQLARSVYVTNDQRFQLKDKINRQFGSEFYEVKSYEDISN